MTRLEKARDNLIRAFRMLPDPVEAADAVIAVVEAFKAERPRRPAWDKHLLCDHPVHNHPGRLWPCPGCGETP